jgi:hypothetical protein
MPKTAEAQATTSPRPGLKHTLAKKTRKVGIERQGPAPSSGSINKHISTHQLVRVAASQNHANKGTPNRQQEERKAKLKDIVAALPRPSSGSSSSSKDEATKPVLSTVYFDKTAFERLTGTSTATDDVKDKPWKHRDEGGPVGFKHVVSASRVVLNKKRRLIGAMSEDNLATQSDEAGEEALISVELELNSEEEVDLRRGSTPQEGGRSQQVHISSKPDIEKFEEPDASIDSESDDSVCAEAATEIVDRQSLTSASSVKTVVLPPDPQQEAKDAQQKDVTTEIKRAWQSASSTRSSHRSAAVEENSGREEVKKSFPTTSEPVKLTIYSSPSKVHKNWLSTPELTCKSWRQLTDVEWCIVMATAQERGFFWVN